MMQKKWTCLALVIALGLLANLSVSSCAKKKISSEPATTTTDEEARRRAEEEARQRELERRKALQEEDLSEESISERMADQRTASARSIFENEDIYFEFDSIRLATEAQEILAQKAEWLQANPTATVWLPWSTLTWAAPPSGSSEISPDPLIV